MSKRTEKARDAEGRLIAAVEESLGVDIHEAYQLVRKLAEMGLVVIDADDYYNLMGLQGAIQTLARAYHP